MINLTIQNKQAVQHDFWGNGAVYHGYAGMPDCDGRIYSEELCEIEAKRAADMKLKIARTFYGWWAWEPETQTWNWDNDRMQPFYRWLQRMKEADITVALNTGWCSPGDVDGTSWNRDCPFNPNDNWEDAKQNYADWVSETVHQLIEIRGFTNIKIFIMFTEPNNGFGNYKAYELWAESVKLAHQTLVRDGRRHYIKMMGSNEGSGLTSEMLEWLSEQEELTKIIDIYSSHTYQTCGPISNEHIVTGSGVVPMKLAGGRISRSVNLQPNTDYVLQVDMLFRPTSDEMPVGEVLVGVFDSGQVIDIYEEATDQPFPSAAEKSVFSVRPTELTTSYQRFTFRFRSGVLTKARIGAFYDIKTEGTLYIDQFMLLEAGKEENLVVNGDFSESYSGWRALYCGGLYDAYFDWYSWCEHAMHFLPNGAPFCFDEYNAIYDRDNSRMSHGAEIVTAAIAFMNCGAQSSLLWTVFDQLWPNKHTTNNDSFFDGDHRCGTMSMLTRTLVPHRSFYAFSLLSRYVDGAGTKVYRGFGKDCIHTTMSVSKEDETTIVVVNNKDIVDTFALTLESPLGKTLHRHRFDPATCVPDEQAGIIPADADFEVNDTITDSIAPYGVTVYTTHND